MPEKPEPTRLYSEKDVRALLRRATELQETEKNPASGMAGLSLPEIQAIAADLGISPEHLRAAALELESGGKPEDLIWLLRLPGQVRIDRTAPGRLQEESWPAAVQTIRHVMGSIGQTGQVGASLEWTSRMDLASVTLSPEKDDTRIQVSFRYGPVVIPVTVLLAFYTFMGLGATMETVHWGPLVEWATGIGGFAGMMTLVRQIMRLAIGRHRKKLARLAERLDAIVRQNVPVPESKPEVELPEPEDSDIEVLNRLRTRT